MSLAKCNSCNAVAYDADRNYCIACGYSEVQPAKPKNTTDESTRHATDAQQDQESDKNPRVTEFLQVLNEKALDGRAIPNLVLFGVSGGGKTFLHYRLCHEFGETDHEHEINAPLFRTQQDEFNWARLKHHQNIYERLSPSLLIDLPGESFEKATRFGRHSNDYDLVKGTLGHVDGLILCIDGCQLIRGFDEWVRNYIKFLGALYDVEVEHRTPEDVLNRTPASDQTTPLSPDKRRCTVPVFVAILKSDSLTKELLSTDHGAADKLWEKAPKLMKSLADKFKYFSVGFVASFAGAAEDVRLIVSKTSGGSVEDAELKALSGLPLGVKSLLRFACYLDHEISVKRIKEGPSSCKAFKDYCAQLADGESLSDEDIETTWALVTGGTPYELTRILKPKGYGANLNTFGMPHREQFGTDEMMRTLDELMLARSKRGWCGDIAAACRAIGSRNWIGRAGRWISNRKLLQPILRGSTDAMRSLSLVTIQCIAISLWVFGVMLLMTGTYYILSDRLAVENNSRRTLISSLVGELPSTNAFSFAVRPEYAWSLDGRAADALISEFRSGGLNLALQDKVLVGHFTPNGEYSIRPLQIKPEDMTVALKQARIKSIPCGPSMLNCNIRTIDIPAEDSNLGDKRVSNYYRALFAYWRGAREPKNYEQPHYLDEIVRNLDSFLAISRRSVNQNIPETEFAVNLIKAHARYQNEFQRGNATRPQAARNYNIALSDVVVKSKATVPFLRDIGVSYSTFVLHFISASIQADESGKPKEVMTKALTLLNLDSKSFAGREFDEIQYNEQLRLGYCYLALIARSQNIDFPDPIGYCSSVKQFAGDGRSASVLLHRSRLQSWNDLRKDAKAGFDTSVQDVVAKEAKERLRDIQSITPPVQEKLTEIAACEQIGFLKYVFSSVSSFIFTLVLVLSSFGIPALLLYFLNVLRGYKLLATDSGQLAAWRGSTST